MVNDETTSNISSRYPVWQLTLNLGPIALQSRGHLVLLSWQHIKDGRGGAAVALLIDTLLALSPMHPYPN